MLREKYSIHDAIEALTRITRHPRHVFWPDNISYEEVQPAGVVGHWQVTGAYLAQLARHNEGRLATFDRGLAAVHHDLADLIPVLP